MNGLNKQESQQPVASTAQTVSPQPVTPQPEERPQEKVEVPAPVEQPQPVETPVEAKPVTVTGTNEAMQYIFAKESSNNPHAINASSGACGLGQAYPCSKLLNACGSLDNIDCQIKFFESYAVARYGSWLGAMYYWQTHNWW